MTTLEVRLRYGAKTERSTAIVQKRNGNFLLTATVGGEGGREGGGERGVDSDEEGSKEEGKKTVIFTCGTHTESESGERRSWRWFCLSLDGQGRWFPAKEWYDSVNAEILNREGGRIHFHMALFWTQIDRLYRYSND